MLYLSDPISKIEADINRGIVRELNLLIPATISNIKNEIGYKLKQVFTNEPEYQSLISGDLGAHLGLSSQDANDKLDKIIDILANSLSVKFKPLTLVGNNISGGITVEAFLDDFTDILSSDAAFVDNSGQKLPWLNWLIIEGDRIIITDYEISFGAFSNSRSGKAVMVKNTGGTWRVPPQYSGTIDNNWITRAINNSSTLLENLISKVIENNLQKIM